MLNVVPFVGENVILRDAHYYGDMARIVRIINKDYVVVEDIEEDGLRLKMDIDEIEPDPSDPINRARSC